MKRITNWLWAGPLPPTFSNNRLPSQSMHRGRRELVAGNAPDSKALPMRTQNGFSLIESLIVVAVILIAR